MKQIYSIAMSNGYGIQMFHLCDEIRTLKRRLTQLVKAGLCPRNAHLKVSHNGKSEQFPKDETEKIVDKAIKDLCSDMNKPVDIWGIHEDGQYHCEEGITISRVNVLTMDDLD